MEAINFQGIKEREWNLDSPVRYIKITGGPPNKEGMLLGLKNGQVFCRHSRFIIFSLSPHEFTVSSIRKLTSEQKTVNRS